MLLDQGHVAIDGRMGKLSETALHVAARQGDAAVVRFLLERKADRNVTDQEGFTPLLNAAEHGELSIVEILVQEGADLTARTRKDSCAFALAAGSTNHALVQWLAEKLPAVDSKDEVLALQTASMYGRLANDPCERPYRHLCLESASLCPYCPTPVIGAAANARAVVWPAPSETLDRPGPWQKQHERSGHTYRA